MDQLRAFRLAPEALAVTALYHPGQGWALLVRVRRGDEEWSETTPDLYQSLTTEEMADALDASARSLLGL